MPIYEYTSHDGTVTELLRRPVAERDAPVIIGGISLQRRTVPSRVSVGVGAQPESMGQKLARGYKALEDRGQLSQGNKNYLPVSTIKKVLAQPDAT